MARKDDDDQVNEDKANSSDENFGLPDLDFKPLEEPANKASESSSGDTSVAGSEKPQESVPPTDAYDPYAEEKSKAPVILTVVIILVVAIAGYLIYNFVYVPRAEKEKQEQLARTAAAKKKAEAERLAKEQAAAEEQRRREEALANAKPAVGTVEILSARTKRYYVIISSDVDDDLLMDYAKKLNATGVSLKVIPPFGGKLFYRLAVTDQETFALAQTSADAAKATYGPGVWVLKY